MKEGNDILLSICCVSYNHEKYLEQCLNSFCNQKTEFKFEVLIHDDASTDNTQEIIKKFEKKYPNIIKPILQTENQFSQGKVRIHSIFNFPRAKGKYIALCESDDYWTDDLKLAKQVTLLENNPKCTLSFHSNSYVFPKELSYKDKVYQPVKRDSNIYDIKDIIKYGGNFMHTGSMVFLKSALPPSGIEWIEKSPVGDLPLSMYFALQGNIIYCEDNMSSYRVFTDSSWTKQKKSSLSMQKDIYSRMRKMWEGFNNYTELKYSALVQNAIKEIKLNQVKGIVKYYLTKLRLLR